MTVKDNIFILKDKSLARIESDFSIEFFPNYTTGEWRKPYSKKDGLQKMSFMIGCHKSFSDAINLLKEIDKLL